MISSSFLLFSVQIPPHLFLSSRYGITFRSIHDFAYIFAVDFEVASWKNNKYRGGAVVSQHKVLD